MRRTLTALTVAASLTTGGASAFEIDINRTEMFEIEPSFGLANPV